MAIHPQTRSAVRNGFTLVELPVVSSCERKAFTLVELLVTISIIAILSSLFLAAMYNAQETARAQKTRSTITKLHNLILERYESYKTRRLPQPGHEPFVDTDGNGICNVMTETYIDWNGNGSYDTNLDSRIFNFPRVAVDVRRELMRREIPERISDVVDDGSAVLPCPSVTAGYKRRLTAAFTANGSPSTTVPYQNHGAECLYMFVMYGLGEEESPRENFHASEIGDTDKNGLPEFVDAWGMPIMFLRWAPGFVSEIQGQEGEVVGSISANGFEGNVGLKGQSGAYVGYNLTFLSGALAGQSREISSYTVSSGVPTIQFSPGFSAAPAAGDGYVISVGRDPDPFDPRGVYDGTFPLVPLIYSAGPDKIYDIMSSREYAITTPPTLRYSMITPPNNPYYVPDAPIGTPMDSNSDLAGPGNGEDNWSDNIHNHLIGTR
jgi:prepilin-type N-terminal cleavage/methylation domain-containing protein